jgi:predicted adenylyl cyclase CyaB
MAVNIEWKAFASAPPRQRELAAALAGKAPELLEQEDTFFLVPHGRLKLRRFGPSHGELIHYFRPDLAGSRQSTYTRIATDQPDALAAMMAKALGVIGVVKKKRWLFLAATARIHLDDVERLGTFLEVEVILGPEQSAAQAELIAEGLRKALEVREEDMIAEAYLDLLLNTGRLKCDAYGPDR